MSELNVTTNGSTITVGEIGYPTCTYEIVDSVPHGYEVWNIGEHMPPGYLALCKLKEQQPAEWCCEIEADTLKAIRIEGAEKIMKVAAGGQNTLKEMEAFVRRHRNAKPGTWEYAQVQRIEAALPIARQIKWE